MKRPRRDNNGSKVRAPTDARTDAQPETPAGARGDSRLDTWGGEFASTVPDSSLARQKPEDEYVVEMGYDKNAMRYTALRAPTNPSSTHPAPSQALSRHTEHAPAPPLDVRPIRAISIPFSPSRRTALLAGSLGAAIALAAAAGISLNFMRIELDKQREDAAVARREAEDWRDQASAVAASVRAVAVELQETKKLAQANAAKLAPYRDALALAIDRGSDAQVTAKIEVLLQQLEGAGPAERIGLLCSIGSLRNAQGRYALAEKCFRAALGEPQATVRQRIDAMAGLAEACRGGGKLDEALSLYARLVDLERTESDASPRMLWHMVELTRLTLRRGNEDASDETVSRLLSMIDTSPAEIDTNELRPMMWELADVAIGHDRHDLAIRLLRRAVALVPDSASADVSVSEQLLLDLYRKSGDTPAVRKLLHKTFVRQKAALDMHPKVADTAVALAECDARLGDLRSCEEMLKLAMQIREKALGSDHPDVAETAQILARIYERQGRHAEADALLALSQNIWEKQRRKSE